jgi:glutamine cyclotransferase
VVLTQSPTRTPRAIASPSPTRTPSPIPSPSPIDSDTPIYGYRIVNAFPHDPNAYTQGLVFRDGVLYEGTGLLGHSTLRKVALETGGVLQYHRLADHFFGEGITIYGDRIIQLTWQSNTGFVYDKGSFERLREFHYPTEGWGLTHDGERLIMSDGTATLHFLDPDSLREIARIDVYDNSGPVVMLNELEYINGEVYANVWLTEHIARIDPQTGRVVGWIDLSGLYEIPDTLQGIAVLNGIAYDRHSDRLFVTGKLWPRLFEIELVPPD